MVGSQFLRLLFTPECQPKIARNRSGRVRKIGFWSSRELLINTKTINVDINVVIFFPLNTGSFEPHSAYRAPFSTRNLRKSSSCVIRDRDSCYTWSAKLHFASRRSHIPRWKAIGEVLTPEAHMRAFARTRTSSAVGGGDWRDILETWHSDDSFNNFLRSMR